MVTIDFQRIPSQIPLLVALAFCVLITGCAETRVLTLEAAPKDLYDPAVPIEVRGVSIVTDRHGYIVAGSGDGIGKGMLLGAGGSIAGGMQSGGPIGLVLGILLAPVAAVGGGIAGGIAAHPTKETNTATESIEHVYGDQPLLGSITEYITERMQRLGMPVQLSYDKSVTLLQSENQSAAFNSTVTECESTQSKNCLLLFVNYGFHTHGDYSPDLKFVIHVKAISTNAVRSNTSEEFSWAYESSKFDFFDATKDKGEILRNKVAVAQERLCDRIINDLFLVRSSARVVGTYCAWCNGEKYIPQSPPADTAYRVPTKAQLSNVTEKSLSRRQ